MANYLQDVKLLAKCRLCEDIFRWMDETTILIVDFHNNVILPKINIF